MADIRIKGQNRSGMRQGFIKVAAVTPKIKVADPVYNGTQICQRMEEACARGAKIIVFPELCITGYTCGDLFMQQLLLEEASRQLLRIAEATAGRDALVMVGLPMEREGRLYNVAAVLWQGQVLGLVPKANIPSYAEFYEGRHFTEGNREPVSFEIGGDIGLGNQPQNLSLPQQGRNIIQTAVPLYRKSYRHQRILATGSSLDFG